MGRALVVAVIASLLEGCFPDRPPEQPIPNAPIVVSSTPRPLPRPPPLPLLPPPARLPLEPCGVTDEGFDDWLWSVRRDAVSLGISKRTVHEALGAVGYDADVIALDRAQAPFKVSFAKFSARHLTRKRVARGKRVMAENHALLERITARFGVPPEILVAIWGLETDYGDNSGTTPSLQALATLAYDCRRAPRFRDELMSALRILDRGDLTLEELFGAWAGERGQTQFLPSSYEKLGVDFDGDGRVDMVRSRADALASTARFLEASGWHAGEEYQPDSSNFAALREWNASEMYCKTIVLFASKLTEP